MIKETVDAVRLAELEAERTVDTVRENAEDRKSRTKSQAEKYRIQELQKARVKAEKEMDNVIRRCDEYNSQKLKEVEEKTEKLRAKSLENFDGAVDAVINAFV